MGLFSGKLDTGVHIRVDNKVWKIIKIISSSIKLFSFSFWWVFLAKSFVFQTLKSVHAHVYLYWGLKSDTHTQVISVIFQAVPTCCSLLTPKERSVHNTQSMIIDGRTCHNDSADEIRWDVDWVCHTCMSTFHWSFGHEIVIALYSGVEDAVELGIRHCWTTSPGVRPGWVIVSCSLIGPLSIDPRV